MESARARVKGGRVEAWTRGGQGAAIATRPLMVEVITAAACGEMVVGWPAAAAAGGVAEVPAYSAVREARTEVSIAARVERMAGVTTARAAGVRGATDGAQSG